MYVYILYYNIYIYINKIKKKEKKLNTALDELKNLDLSNPNLRNNIENLNLQKTQLEIEKSQLEDKYKSLLEEHSNLEKKLQEIKDKEKLKYVKGLKIPPAYRNVKISSKNDH